MPRSAAAMGETMSVSITAIYAGILALIIVALGINVTIHRVKLRVPLGDGGNAEMLRMIRLHGNATESIPLVLILMLAYELGGGLHWILHAAGIALIVGRILLTVDLWGSEIAGLGRKTGQSLTWLPIIALALLNLSRLF
jgi:uncharacterized membrane protein YecN with MAPEG domain